MERKPVCIQDLWELQFVSDPRFSPDGSRIAYLVTNLDPASNTYQKNLWVYNRAEKASSQLTRCGHVRGWFWTPEGIVIWRVEEGASRISRLNPATGMETPLFTLPLAAQKLRWLERDLYAVTAYTSASASKDPSRYQILEEAPYCSNGRGITAGQRLTLYLYHAADDRLEPLTDPKTDTVDFVYRGGTLLYQAITWEDYLPTIYAPAFHARDCRTGRGRLLTEQGRINSFALCFWKDDELLFSGIEDNLGKSMGQNADFYTLELSTGTIRRFADADMKIGYNGSGSDAKYGSGQGIYLGQDGVYFLAPVMDGTCINRMDFRGEICKNITETADFSGSIESFDLHGKDLVCAKMERCGLAELYLNGQQITDFNGQYLRSHAISEPEPVVWESGDGTLLHGFCMKPRNFIPGRKYPGILHIHGGPKTIFGDVFHHEMQLWASNGFFVFYCNPHGSDGRGRAFADIRGRWGTVDYQDLMDFTDTILARYPELDESRLGVCGGSYGGFMTNWIIGHTNRFAAACSQRSFANMINFEYLSDIGLSNIYSEHLHSTEENLEAVWNESPLKYAPGCKTPTLFIHSDQDCRCPLPDALEMFSCLKRAGCPARLCLFHGENHELSRSGRPDNRITRLEEILSWFIRYLHP